MNFRAAQSEDGPEMARLLNAARHFPLVTAEDCSAQLQSGSGVRAWMGAGGDAYVQYYLHPYNGPMFWCACQPQESARDCLDFIESQAEDSFMLVVADKFPVLLKHLAERNYRQISQELAQTLEIAQFTSDLEALDRARADGFLFTTFDQLEDSKVIDSLFEFEPESAADVPNAKIQRRPDRSEFQQRPEQQKPITPFGVWPYSGGKSSPRLSTCGEVRITSIPLEREFGGILEVEAWLARSSSLAWNTCAPAWPDGSTPATIVRTSPCCTSTGRWDSNRWVCDSTSPAREVSTNPKPGHKTG